VHDLVLPLDTFVESRQSAWPPTTLPTSRRRCNAMSSCFTLEKGVTPPG
jgi:hypothetical protein